jgi:hypothetical protein
MGSNPDRGHGLRARVAPTTVQKERSRMIRRTLPVLLGVVLLAACGGDETPPSADATPATRAAPSEALAATTARTATDLSDAELPTVLVYKTPTCGCCNGWVEHLREAGFEVEARDVRDLMSVKMDAGIPADLSSCHTALVDGYVVEGHVPAEVVRKLVAERPQVAGISVPGMPIGSPGMEGPNPEPYTVEAFTADGSRSAYARIDPR